MLDGIKKLSGQDLKKAREVVLQSIGEKSKTAKPVKSISQDEARKIEAATAKFKPKQVDGLVNRRQTTDDRRQTAENRRQTTDNRQQVAENRKQTVDDRQQTMDDKHVFVSADSEAVADDSIQDKEKLEKAKAEQLKLKWQKMRKKNAMEKKQQLEKVEQERLNQEKIREKQIADEKNKLEQLKRKPSFAKAMAGKHKNTKTQKHKNNETMKHKNTKTLKQKNVMQEKNKKAKAKTQKQARILLDESKAGARPRLLITCYLLLVLTLIIIVGSVGFFTILYNLNNYAVLAKVSKVKQMMESEVNFYQIAKSQGDEFGVGKYYTYNEAATKFGQNIVNLKAGQISIIEHASNGYYLIQCYGRRGKLVGLKYIFIKAKSLDEYVSEMMVGFRLW